MMEMKYAASWQTYPLIEDVVSFNDDYFRKIEVGSWLKRAVDTQLVQIADQSGMIFPPRTTENDDNEPVALLAYPVIEGGQTKALLSLLFPWSLYLKDILREDQTGVIIVAENECTGSFTYEINGPQTQFLGFGDHHLRHFRNLQRSAFIPDLLDEAYFGLRLDSDRCPTTLKAYPNKALEDAAMSAVVPWLLALGTLSIFIFAMVIFGLYDELVRRRHKQVMRAGTCDTR